LTPQEKRDKVKQVGKKLFMLCDEQLKKGQGYAQEKQG
jgi:hypothetical protein